MTNLLKFLVVNYLEPLRWYHIVMVIHVFMRIIGCQMLCVLEESLNC